MRYEKSYGGIGTFVGLGPTFGTYVRLEPKYARRVRKRLGLSQREFARRINVSLDTIRNWEQGKRRPSGAARALLKVLDKAPETVLRII